MPSGGGIEGSIRKVIESCMLQPRHEEFLEFSPCVDRSTLGCGVGPNGSRITLTGFP